MVERTPDRQRTLDSLYEAYRSGSYNPTADRHRNEIYQLGFRTAARAGLSRVQTVDREGLWPGDQAQSVAKQHNPELLKAYRVYGQRMLTGSPQIRSRNSLESGLQFSTAMACYTAITKRTSTIVHGWRASTTRAVKRTGRGTWRDNRLCLRATLVDTQFYGRNASCKPSADAWRSPWVPLRTW